MTMNPGTPSAGSLVARSESSEADGYFHLFVYGTLRKGGVSESKLVGCVHVGEAVIEGTLYDLGDFPALMLYGSTPVGGDVWRCPVSMLSELDEYEQIETGLFRRVAVMAGEYACWAYVAGPGLAQRLTPERRLPRGEWSPRVRG